MATYQLTRYIRPFEDAKANILERAKIGRFANTEYELVESVMNKLTSLDKDAWAAGFMEVAEPIQKQAQEEEARGDIEAARKNYMRAYAYFRLGRFPTINSPGKKESWRRSIECYLAAAKYLDPPLQRIEMPFEGRPGEGDKVIGYYRRPKGVEKPPLVIGWGGIDGYKEDRHPEPYLKRGIAVLSIDGAGVGESPLHAANDGERHHDAALNWARSQPDIDSSRIAMMGASTGGYWAAKIAHIRRDLIACAVNHGGCAHYAFQPEWIEKAQDGEYAYELAETLDYAFYGTSDFDHWLENAPKMSLLNQGILDQPCAPLLCVNGTRDTTFPIEDHFLLFDHGDPKWGFFAPVNHMGNTPITADVILDWICDRLGVAKT